MDIATLNQLKEFIVASLSQQLGQQTAGLRDELRNDISQLKDDAMERFDSIDHQLDKISQQLNDVANQLSRR